jgi:hypothetical protein
MTYLGPLYVCVGFGLIMGISYVYLAVVFQQFHGMLRQTLHLAFGAFLLLNILFNYYLCMRTQPGTTESLKEVIRDTGHAVTRLLFVYQAMLSIT